MARRRRRVLGIVLGAVVTVVCVTALALCFLSTLYPANKAAKLKPVEALRHD